MAKLRQSTIERIEKAKSNQFTEEGVPMAVDFIQRRRFKNRRKLEKDEFISYLNETLKGQPSKGDMARLAESLGFIPSEGGSYSQVGIPEVCRFFSDLAAEYYNADPDYLFRCGNVRIRRTTKELETTTGSKQAAPGHIAAPKRRGRPKKIQIDEGQAEDITPPKKRRGRPPKAKVDSTPAVFSPPKTSKRRGRPKKESGYESPEVNKVSTLAERELDALKSDMAALANKVSSLEESIKTVFARISELETTIKIRQMVKEAATKAEGKQKLRVVENNTKLSEAYDLRNVFKDDVDASNWVDDLDSNFDDATLDFMLDYIATTFGYPIDSVKEDFAGRSSEEVKEVFMY